MPRIGTFGTCTIVRGTKISGKSGLARRGRKRRAVGVGAFGDEHQLLAALRVGHGRRPRACSSGQTLRDEILDGAERHHLTRDLREALRAPLDRHESLGIDVDDVAGVVPAVSRRLEHAGLLGAQVAEHHVRAADEEPAAVVDALDCAPADARMPGSSRPTVPALKCIGVFTASAGDVSVAP